MRKIKRFIIINICILLITQTVCGLDLSRISYNAGCSVLDLSKVSHEVGDKALDLSGVSCEVGSTAPDNISLGLQPGVSYAAGGMGRCACNNVLCMRPEFSYAADEQNESNGSEFSYAEDPNESSNSVQSLQLLGRAARELAARMCEAAEDAVNPPITRREVYRIKPGKKISGKELKRRGGPGRYFQIYKIRKGDRVYKQIAGRSYNPGGVISLSDLRYIRTLYYDFKGRIRSGEIIVNQSVAEDTRDVFRELFKVKYQIRKMRLVDNYFPSGKTQSADPGEAGRSNGKADPGKAEWEPAVWTSAAAEAADTASMNDDNTSGFNYRMVAGTSSISMHGYGRAIDVNPFENPWCPGGRLYPNQKESASYANRANVRDHMIYADSKITKIFKEHGFRWLGETGTRDYQHFER